MSTPTHEQYQVPPGTAAQAAQEAVPTPPLPVELHPTMTDALAADAGATQPQPEAKTEFPPGCPEFTPMHRLEFVDRAEAFGMFGEIQDMLAEHGNPSEGGAVIPAAGKAFYLVLDKISKMLQRVAADEQAYLAWDGRLDENLVIQAFNAYQEQRQPGEASRSSS